MTKRMIVNRVRKLDELNAKKKELENEINALKEEIQTEMGENEEYDAGEYLLKFTKVITNRFDSASFKKTNEDVYNNYIKQTHSRRFTYTAI